MGKGRDIKKQGKKTPKLTAKQKKAAKAARKAKNGNNTGLLD
jgi:hypothetical protein